jgi:hypothetical protein
MRWTRQRRARVSNCGAATSFVLCCERLLLAADERCYCVRQNRVVPAPVAGVKLCEGEVPDRVQPLLPIREATEARRIRLRGERGISRQTIVQGRPGCLGYACGCSSCAFCAICAAQGPWVPAGTRSSLRPLTMEEGRTIMRNSGVPRRERALLWPSRLTEYFRACQGRPYRPEKPVEIRNASGERFDHQGQSLHCRDI